jgi:hypothetical protein
MRRRGAVLWTPDKQSTSLPYCRIVLPCRPCSKKRRQHFLKSTNQVIGFAGALREIFDLLILDRNFGAQKVAFITQRFIFMFKYRGQCIFGATNVRVRSRLFGLVRGVCLRLSVLIFQGANVRVRSRLVASGRVWSHLVDVGNVSLDRVGGYQVLLPGFGFDFVAIELRERTIFLDGADGPRVTSRGVQLGRLLNRKGILVVRRTVAAVRVHSRLFVSHGLMIPRRASTSRRLSPIAKNELTGEQCGAHAKGESDTIAA